jgi:hypothetical protein
MRKSKRPTENAVTNDATVAEAVRDQLKKELAEFRNSIDRFSLDIQWAARQVRQACAEHRIERGSTSVAEPTSPHNVPTEYAAVDSRPTTHLALQTSIRDTRQPFLFKAE